MVWYRIRRCKGKKQWNHGTFLKANEFEALGKEKKEQTNSQSFQQKKRKRILLKREEMEIGINALLQSCEGNGSSNALNDLL